MLELQPTAQNPELSDCIARSAATTRGLWRCEAFSAHFVVAFPNVLLQHVMLCQQGLADGVFVLKMTCG